MPKSSTILTVNWAVDETYQFYVIHQAREMFVSVPGADPRKDRCKNVYRGYFIDRAPNGVEPNVVCWLKQIRIDEKREYPQLREQYDMADFPEGQSEHLRHLLARNPEADRIVQEIRDGHTPRAQADCFMVERSYAELLPEHIQYLTPRERLEYICQYCTALKELYKTSKSVYNWPVAAHRDVKIGNGLILRYNGRFQVVLLDFSSIRFEADSPHAPIPDTYRPEFISSKGSQGTNPYLMSHENTCLEIVSSKYPTTRATDVYALGTMLASLFGYVTPNHRNPNAYLCTKPDPQDNQKRITLDHHMMEARLLHLLPRDKKLGDVYRGTTWMEQTLEQARTPFTWGDPKGAPYHLDAELLEQVKELFFEATRMDPADRISMEDFHVRIQTLKNATPKERSNSPKLYMFSECVYLIHQDALQEHKAWMQDIVASSLDRPDSDFPIHLCWYQSRRENTDADDTDDAFTPITSARELLTKIGARSASASAQYHSLVHALYGVWCNYDSYQYENSFNGTIHIFSSEAFEGKVFRPIIVNGKKYTFNQLLEHLTKLQNAELKVRFHSPYKLKPAEHHSSFKRVVVPGPEVWAGTAQSAPDPDPKPEPPKREAAPAPEQPAAPEEPLEKYYLFGSEGLFFLDEDGRKVYVTKRKMRR